MKTLTSRLVVVQKFEMRLGLRLCHGSASMIYPCSRLPFNRLSEQRNEPSDYYSSLGEIRDEERFTTSLRFDPRSQLRQCYTTISNNCAWNEAGLTSLRTSICNSRACPPRWSSQYARRGGAKDPQKNPFDTLGVPNTSSYADAKKAFLKLAIKYHPDTATSKASSDDERRQAVNQFMTARSAFERIVELDDGSAAESDENRTDDDEEFNSWFKKETGYAAPEPFDLNLDKDTLKEVADASATQAGLDRGGMWAMASMVTQGLATTSSIGPQLRLEEGESSSPRNRRRRKRRR